MPSGVYDRTKSKPRRRITHGEYKDNPAESTKTCADCGGIFHHQGFPHHARRCATRTPQERIEFAAGAGRYNYSKKGRPRKLLLPVTVQQLESAAPRKPIVRPLPAPNSMFESNGHRVGVSISFERADLMKLLANAKIEPDPE